MNLNNIKENIFLLKGKYMHFNVIGSRNLNLSFNAIITATYPAIFTIKTDQDKLLSFSYNDVCNKTIEIIPVKH